MSTNIPILFECDQPYNFHEIKKMIDKNTKRYILFETYDNPEDQLHEVFTVSDDLEKLLNKIMKEYNEIGEAVTTFPSISVRGNKMDFWFKYSKIAYVSFEIYNIKTSDKNIIEEFFRKNKLSQDSLKFFN